MQEFPCPLLIFSRQNANTGKMQTMSMTIPACFGVSVLLVLTSATSAQTPPPVFEVASVKPSGDKDFRNGRFEFLPGGKLVIRNIPLLMIVATAYNVPFQSPQLTGSAEWQKVALTLYDIEAVAEKGALAPDLTAKDRENRMKLMLQPLLEDRFKMKIRREQRDQPIYALVVAPGGPKLPKSKKQEKDCDEPPAGSATPSGCHILGGGQGRGLHGEAVTIADIVLFVQNWTDRPMIDKTGLTDLYTINTEGWTPMRQAPPRPDGPPQGGDAGLNDPDRQTLPGIFKELGLRMESQRAAVDMFFVEHIEPPVAN
jgi:uncharacterized protein (TIGR03435 family)